MTIYDGLIGRTYNVTGTKLELKVECRLEALGLTNNTKIRILNKKRNGAVIFKVRGTRIAAGKRIAQGIQVEEVASND